MLWVYCVHICYNGFIGSYCTCTWLSVSVWSTVWSFSEVEFTWAWVPHIENFCQGLLMPNFEWASISYIILDAQLSGRIRTSQRARSDDINKIKAAQHATLIAHISFIPLYHQRSWQSLGHCFVWTSSNPELAKRHQTWISIQIVTRVDPFLADTS